MNAGCLLDPGGQGSACVPCKCDATATGFLFDDVSAEGLLEGVYDPYIFYRDAYRQRRLYEIYRGNPPIDAIQILQGTNEIDDADKLLKEQQDYENKTKTTVPSSPTVPPRPGCSAHPARRSIPDAAGAGGCDRGRFGSAR